jgi:hypothetical protein
VARDWNFKTKYFLGLSEKKTLPNPSCFGSDIMHLLSLNIPDLCGRSMDDRSCQQCLTYHWQDPLIASLAIQLRKSLVAITLKAWEFLLYLFGLRPGLLYNILPEKYWKNFCKLVYGVRIVNHGKSF